MTCIALDDEPLALVLIEKTQPICTRITTGRDITNPKAAAEFLQHNTVDLLISDINMPDINGLQFIRDLPDERPMVIFFNCLQRART